MDKIVNLIDQEEKNVKFKRVKVKLSFLAIFILFGICSLFFITKSSNEIEGRVVSVSLVASSEHKNYQKVFFETTKGFKGVFKQPQYKTINIGDKILCLQTENFFGATRYKFIKKL
jgi:hypothetical protein